MLGAYGDKSPGRILSEDIPHPVTAGVIRIDPSIAARTIRERLRRFDIRHLGRSVVASKG